MTLSASSRTEVQKMIEAALVAVVGVPGPKGDPGPAGPPGPTPSSWTIMLGALTITIVPTPTPPVSTATRSLLVYSQGGNPMTASAFTVDTTTGKVRATFEDDKGDTDAPAPAGTVAAFSIIPGPSGAVPATTGAVDPSDPSGLTFGPLVPGPEGDTGAVHCTYNGTALEADGTPIADPADWAFTVVAGQAVASALAETQ